MHESLTDLRSAKNPKARIKILKGHFATGNSHINTYIDISTVKSRHNNCRETAKELAREYMYTTSVDTIVCLEETDAIGICSVFSSIQKINGLEVKTIFTKKDIPDYRAYAPSECPMCKEGKKLEAIVNSYGYSKL